MNFYERTQVVVALATVWWLYYRSLRKQPGLDSKDLADCFGAGFIAALGIMVTIVGLFAAWEVLHWIWFGSFA